MADKDVFDGCPQRLWVAQIDIDVREYEASWSSYDQPVVSDWWEVGKCGDKEIGICPSCVKAARAERDEIKQVLDDSGQVEGWSTPEGACLLARRVKAVVVCRDVNSDTVDEATRHIETLTATLKAYKGRWDELTGDLANLQADAIAADKRSGGDERIKGKREAYGKMNQNRQYTIFNNPLPGEGETKGADDDN